MCVNLTWPGSAYGNWPVSITVANSTTSWNPLAVNTPNVNLNNATISVGSADTQASVNWSSSDGYSGSFTVTFDAGSTGPQGLSVDVESVTWNSITLNGSLTSWGTHTDPNQAFCMAVLDPSATTWGSPRLEWRDLAPGDALSFTGTVDNNSYPGDGGITIKGNSYYRIGILARNGSGEENTGVRYPYTWTAPAPLQSVTLYSQTDTGSGYDLVINVVGGDNTVNGDVDVYTYSRYSTDGGATWSAWARELASDRAWDTKSIHISVGYVTSVLVEARQSTYNRHAYSEVTQLLVPLGPILYGSVDGFARKVRKLYGPVNGQSKKITKLYASVNGQSKLIYKE